MGYPYFVNGVTAPEHTMVAPFPAMLWRTEATVDDGYPYLSIYPDVRRLLLVPQTQPWKVHVFGSGELDFASNGLAILQPISCQIRQEKNGRFEASIGTHADGNADYLQPGAVLQIPMIVHDAMHTQLFRIYETKRSMDKKGSQRVSCTAKHIFYDLSDTYLEDCRPTQLQGQAALDWMMDRAYGMAGLPFMGSSDISDARTAYYQHLSMAEALLGADNSFVTRWGGELYRDNFYFSINRRMEGCRTTGVIRYGYNLTEIHVTVDDSECVTHLIAEDNFGHRMSVKNADVPSAQFPHHRYRYVQMSYDTDDEEQFRKDVQAYYDNYKQPAVNIKVKFADIANMPEYADFLQLAGYEVGDRVIIYHTGLGISYENLEIISKTYDAVLHRTEEVEIGSFKDAVYRESYMSGTVSGGSSATDKQLAALQGQLDQTTAKQLMYWDNLEDYSWDELEQYTWDMLEGEY